MPRYQVRYRRWKRGYELHVLGVGVTQSHSLKDAPAIVRDYVAEMCNVSKANVQLDLAMCDYPDKPCLICKHEACGWCPDCAPGVPQE